MLDNLQAVAAAAGGSLDDIVKLTLLLADLGDFAKVNEIMATRFTPALSRARDVSGGGAAQSGAESRSRACSYSIRRPSSVVRRKSAPAQEPKSGRKESKSKAAQPEQPKSANTLADKLARIGVSASRTSCCICRCATRIAPILPARAR